MKHLSGEQLVSKYYEGLDDGEARHFDACFECRAEFERIKELLDGTRDFPVPHRDGSYGSQVWTRLQPKLPLEPERAHWLSWRWLGPAFATVALLAFFAGMFTQRHTMPAGLSAQARTRVLLIAMGDHFDRSQMVLAEIVNANPQKADLREEQARARELLAENRLLRETASRAGDGMQASVLDRLERVLLDIANGPAKPAPADLEELQQRIQNQGLLFEMRIIGSNARQKGQKL
jgi:hypothetical protein